MCEAARQQAAGMEGPPSPSELLQAVAILGRLKPDDISAGELSEELSALRNAGHRLFGPFVLQERFGQADVVAYLKEKNRHEYTLKKLEKLQRNIDREHEKMRSQSARAQINKQRDERFAAIEAAALGMRPALGMAQPPALTDESGTPPPEATAGAEGTGEEGGGGGGGGGGAAARGAGEEENGEEGGGAAEGEAVGSLEERLRQTADLPLGSFRRRCGVCKCAYSEVDDFYHQVRAD